MRTYPEKPKPILLRVTGPEHQAEYDRLMSLYRVAEHADAIKSLVVHLFHMTGIWGLTHETWTDFCSQALHTSKSHAARLSDEGAVARKLLSGDPFLRKTTSQLTSINRNISAENRAPVPNGTEFSDFIENSLPEVTSKHAVIARDRKLLRIVKAAPENKWIEVATEASKHGPPTSESVKAAVDKIAPKAAKATTKPKIEPRIAPFLNALQDAIEYFQKVLSASFAEQIKCAGGIRVFTQRINREAKKIRC